MSQIDDFLSGKPAAQEQGESQIDAFLGDAPKRSLTRSVGDSAIALGTGVVQGVKMLTDVAGADNAVSRGLGKASDALSDMESPYRKAQKQERATKIKAAEDSGSTWEEVKAHAGAFADAPIDTTLNAIGTSVPTLATAAIPGLGQAALATRAAQVGVGVAQGVGNIKGQIHETVKQKLMGEGVSESEASQQADAAQAYGGGNMGSIALGGALGGLAGGTGAESAARRLLGRQLAGEVAERAAPGLVRSAVGGVLKEAPMEAVQGGQERLAGNLALQGEGFDVPTWQGVAGQAALEGLASAPMGGGFGLADGLRARAEAQARQQAEAEAQQARDEQRSAETQAAQTSAMVRADTLAQEESAPPEVQQTTPPDGRVILDARRAESSAQDSPDDEIYQSTGADVAGASPVSAAPIRQEMDQAEPDQRTPSQRMGIDPTAGPLSKLAASAVDSGLAQEAQFLGATGRDLQVRRTGPGVADESNVIDVQGRVVEDRAIGTPRRIEAARRVGGAEAESFSTGANQHQFSANAQANGSAANAAPALSLQAQAAMNSVADQPQNLPNGVPNGRQAAQAQQTAQEPAQAGAAPRSTAERAPLEGGPGAAGEVLQGAAGVGRAATSQNIGAQGQEAARAQGTAQAAAEPVAGRPDGWRKSMLKAGPVAKAMGIDPKGKRLAQVVAEIDAADAQRTGVRQDGAKSTPVTRAGDIARGLRDQIDGIAAQDKRQGMYRQEALRLRAAADGMGTTSEPGAAYAAAADMLDAWAGQVGADSVADIVALHEANGPYPPSAATRIGDGQWLPAVKTGPDSGQPIAGAPTFSDAGSAAAWAGYEQAKGRAGADVAALQRLQDSIEGRQQPIGETDAAPRNLRLADERAPGAAAPAQDGAGPAAGGAAPSVGAGRRAGGDSAKPAPAVRAAVPDAGGTGKQGSGVAPTDPSQSANSRSASEKLGREVSREIGKYKQGMSEHRANEVRAELARKNPEVIYSVEEDASLKNGFVVVGRKPAPGAKLGVEKLKASKGRAPLQFSRGLRKATDFVPNADGGLDYGEITPEMGKAMRRQAGVIRLQQGVQNQDGTGYGLRHIEANHGKQILGMGYKNVQEFVAHVASGIQQVWQVPGNSQLLVTVKDGRKDVMYIQLEIAKEGDFYRVNSAFPVRQQDYEALHGLKKIWDGSEPTSAVTGQRPAFATAASASPDSESSQGSSNARGQNSSVPPSQESAKYSRTPATKTAYEARIDALFAGEKPRLQGARVLDRSDMLAFLGFGDGPVNLSEGKVVVGKDNHPHMTAAVWKKIPEWLENPALVFDSDTTQGRLVFIAPEMVNGSPVRIIVEPNAAGGVKAHLLVNAYDAKGGSFRRWESDGLLRYVDRNKYAHVSGSFQPQLAGLPGDRGRRNIVTDKQYNGWRRANNTAYSQEMSPELANTLLAIRRPATKESVRAAVRELVNGMGVLPNRLGRVVVATAAEIKQDWEPLIGSVQLHSEQGDGDGAAQGFYDPKSKTVFLIADHIRQGDELGVVAHELMHKHGQAVLGEEGWNRLHGAIEGWASAPEGSQERQVYDEAVARVRQSRPDDAAAQEYSSQELFPYAVQVALEQGIRPNLLAKPGTVARWLGQVKAALRDAWSKIVGKPESFNAQDLVNLAFGIAQRENPEHARELDGAANGAPEDRVGSTLLELGRDERLYQYPKSDSKDIVQIGAVKDLTVGPVDRNASESDVWMLANTTPEDGDGVQSWMVRLPNGKPATITDNKGQVYINVSAVGEGGGGSRVYDLAANYALNNGAVFVGDPNGVSPSAMRRRLENMLSSAIKYGTTDHLAPHPDQVAGRDGVAPLEWTPGDTLGNIESMVNASVAATKATNPLATSYVRFEPQTRSFDIDPDYGGRSGQVAQDLSDLLDFDGRKVGLGQGGRRTVQRAVFFRALLSGVGERRSVLAAFRDEQGRGSARLAAPEEGTTDQEIFYSRSVAATPATGDYTPDQRLASERAFGVQNQLTLAERAKSFRANLGTRLRQGMVDQFAPIKEVSDKAYMLARMSKGSDGAVEAALLYGKPFLRDGVYDVDIKDGGFAKVLATLKGEHDRFFQWVAAQRAERLKAEGKENLLTDQDITALRTLNAGKMADGSARMPVYAAALRELNAFNESTLKVAMESGLIDQAAFDLMKDQPYVPFYRLMEEDGGMRGPRFSSGLVNQQAWKKLKGGTQQINADLVQNTLLNWSHLYGAAARNRASLETMAAAEKMGIAYQVPADTKGAVKVMRDGVAEHWAVEDPYLLDAISAMSYAPGGIVKAMAPFKRLLTFGITVNPTFKIRNLIRDSLSAIAQSELSYNPLENVAKGWTATSKESQTYASMLASGGIIKFGTQEDSGRVRTLIEKLGGQVLDQDGWSKLKGQMRSLWETYEEFGDRTENVNRAALYERLVAKGHSHAEASFMARDLMDFSMSGKWEVVRFLTQTVPFLNARMQGLYKLGRAAKEDPRRFAAMAGAVSLASLGLLAAYGDDDDWKKREDWDRDNYWWFKIGTMAFRIPKPFEVGAIGTVAERTAELMMSDEMTGKRFGQRISDMVFNTFAMDPTPQFIKPFIDIYANKDSFSGRPIEGLADERLRPQDRYNERTSEVARLLGSWGLPDPVRLAKGEYSGLSPKQIDFLLRGYFGWIATVATTVTDAAARPMLDRGERPAMRLRDTFLAGNFLETLPTGSSRYVSAMYEQARDVEQAWASYQAAVKSGDMDKAREIQQDEAPKLRNRVAVEHAKRQIAELGQQAKRIESNRLMPADEKRRRLDELEARKHEAARRVAPTS